MDLGALLIFAVILIVALYIPWKEGLMKKNQYFLVTIIALGLAFALRASYLNFRSGDYNTFLIKWVDFYRQSGGFKGLGTSVGNYNLPYLYALSLFSYSSINDLYLIKLLSITFDVVLAFGMMKLAGVFTRSPARRLGAYLVTLLLPTVIINSAKWGQCDSIYVAFAVLALWLILTDRPKLSMVMMALSFGFKLQAIFIMPVFLVMLFAKRIKIWDFLVFPATYLVLILPAVIAGRPVLDAFTLYYDQAGTVGSGLNYNSPSIFALFRNIENASSASAVAVALAFFFVIAILLWTFFRRKNLNNESLLFVSLLFVVGIPLLLPHMHDRYFYMADVLILITAVIYLGFAPLTVFVSFASIICYYAYFNLQYWLPLKYGTFALIAVLIVLLIHTASRLGSRRFKILKK